MVSESFLKKVEFFLRNTELEKITAKNAFFEMVLKVIFWQMNRTRVTKLF